MFTVIVSAIFFLSIPMAIAGKINIDVNCTMKPGGSEEASIKKFKEIVEAKSNGRLEVRMFMSGQLGKENAVLELLNIGATQMSLTGGNFRGMFAKAYDAVAIPFALENWEVVKAYLEGPIGDKIKELAQKKGGIIDFGPQKRSPRIMTANKPIKTALDLRGLKLRLPAVPVWVRVWKQLGTLPTIIPASEIYLAMKTGQVDAHENSLVSPYSRKLWEVQKYIINTNHVFWPWHWVASKIWFEKLSVGDQNIIREAVDEARAYGGQVEDERESFYIAELKKHNMIFIDPDMASIKAKAMPAIKDALAELEPEAAKEVDRLNAMY
ncbi:MAG: TRAP transporter substrate-binding protein [Calditrichaeota bacterium]|nr:TRAP transporter substrate-binding protein [Calditrichota bacterium]